MGPWAREHLREIKEEVGDLLLGRFQPLKLTADGRRNSARHLMRVLSLGLSLEIDDLTLVAITKDEAEMRLASSAALVLVLTRLAKIPRLFRGFSITQRIPALSSKVHQEASFSASKLPN